MADFSKIIANQSLPKKQLKRLKRRRGPSAQEQKYSLVPKWRRRPGGRKGQMR